MATPLAGEAAPDAPARSLWRNRDFLLLWSGQVISTLGTQMSTLALPLLILSLLHSPAQAGFIAAVRIVPYIAFSLPAGALIDRWNRKLVMIYCDTARFLAYGSIPLAYALGNLTIAHLYAVALVEGTAFVFFNIAEIACLPRVVAPAQMPQASAFNASGEAAALLVGPGIGGLIVGLARTVVAGATLAYMVDALTYLTSVFSLTFIRTPFQGERVAATGRSLREEIAQGLRFLWEHRTLRIMALLVMTINALFGAINLAIILLAQQDLHTDAQTIGLIFSLASVGGIAAPWVKRRLHFGQIIIGATLVQATGVAVAALAASPVLLIVAGLIVFVALPIFNVTSISYRLSLIPDELQGRVNSVSRLFAFGGALVGTAVGGVALGPVGARVELWVIAVGAALSALTVCFTELRKA